MTVIGRQPFVEHTGRGVVLGREDVDTDQIIPAEHCMRLDKDGYADSLFATWRQDLAFVLNQPEAAGASILIAGRNFGTGSSREHAVWALRDWGFRAVVASSFGDIFARNAMQNGLLAVALDRSATAALAELVSAAPAAAITIDLRSCRVRTTGAAWDFEIDPRLRHMMLEGLDAIDFALAHGQMVDTYERARPAWLPTFAGSRR